MLKVNRAIGIVSAILVVLLAFAGCTGMGNNDMRNNAGTPQGLQDGRNNVTEGRMLDNDVNDGDIGERDRNDDIIQGNDGRKTDTGTSRQKAMRIEAECEKIPGVQDVEVLISGDTAVVGCRTTQDINNLRKQIESQIKKADPSVKNVSVTNSRDLLIEIRKLSDEMGDRPDAGNIETKVRQLIDKITPEQ